MDTLIFAGLLATWYALVRERSRAGAVVGWWLAALASVGLFAYLISGDLSMGLTF
ncbi:DUF5993 family protein [Streptomyces bohaiensis]|uniref:Uncharacterized protein n=1 Tax=Streptomyces bohaiensis TaxID=1431344 RepID=A0ABX1CI21_9ACTN|nr:DUF5993 family protein [Streptomyces bohaiensis]NJQ16884.1 hypothetical protein [Streptomyces bohaiensis]